MANVDNNIERISEEHIRLNLDVNLYSRDAILSTAYLFTDKCHINFLSYGDRIAQLDFMQKNHDNYELELVVKDFLNELIDQQLRVRIHNETKDIKKMIISEAFAPLENIPELEK